jgi:flagellar protein FlaG
MISQIANAVNLASGSPGQPAPTVEFKPQQSAPVELPQQAVDAVEKVDAETVRVAAEQVTKLVQQFNRNLQFLVDEETNKSVVKVIDAESKEVIRQFPTEEMLAIARALEKLKGLLIEDKA